MNVTVVGTGYVGLVAGACFADTGNTVVCLDVDAAKVERLRRAEIPIVSGIEIVAKLHHLTPAEIKVMHAAMTMGGTTEIANALGISVPTVKSHFASLFRKTGTRRRSDLIKEVAAHGSPLQLA